MKSHFEENFLMELGEGWAWVHEEPDAWRIADGVLQLRTLPGTLWGDPNNAYNFLLRSVHGFTSSFATRVSVTNEPQIMGEQAGLIWYHDDDNYIKLVKESLEGEEWIVLAREKDGQPELVKKVRINTGSAELQLKRVNGNVFGQFRTSVEDDFQTVGDCTLVKDDESPRVGLFTHGGPADSERWVEMRAFRILGI